MSNQIKVIVHAIATDGLPPEEGLVGRVAFLFDGNVVSGWPIREGRDDEWEADSDVGKHGVFQGVAHWVEFPVAVWELPRLEAPTGPEPAQ